VSRRSAARTARRRERRINWVIVALGWHVASQPQGVAVRLGDLAEMVVDALDACEADFRRECEAKRQLPVERHAAGEVFDFASIRDRLARL